MAMLSAWQTINAVRHPNSKRMTSLRRPVCVRVRTGRGQADGHGPDDLLRLIVEIKGYRREDAKEKKSTTETYWVPGVNHLKQYGRWGFAEFTEIYQIEADFKAKVASEFDKMITKTTQS